MNREERLKLAAACWEAEDTDIDPPRYFSWRHNDSVGWNSCMYCNGGSAKAGCPNAYGLPVYPKEKK